MANKAMGLQGVFTHIVKGGRYKVIAIGKMQIGQKWLDCFIYQQMDSNNKPTRNYFVREYNDFNMRFKNIEDTLRK